MVWGAPVEPGARSAICLSLFGAFLRPLLSFTFFSGTVYPERHRASVPCGLSLLEGQREEREPGGWGAQLKSPKGCAVA